MTDEANLNFSFPIMRLLLNAVWRPESRDEFFLILILNIFIYNLIIL